MKFIDEVKIDVRAGHGGSGCKHFHREKFVPLGGPDGGDGGDGGSVILVGDRNKQTLLDFKHRPNLHAEDGSKGDKNRCTGKGGEDLVLKLPVGTQIFNYQTGELVFDIVNHGEQFILAKGGRGGKGNAFFKSPTNQTPEHFQPGEPGEEGSFLLSLKLIAEVGLIGFPNAGKSTLISRISAARPKIADYPFTTLVPQLGVVEMTEDRSFVVADIPGLIPDAHKGKGLGVQFLKHVERTKVLAHLIECTPLLEENGEDEILKRFESINYELKAFSEELSNRPQIVLLTKADILPETQRAEKVIKLFKGKGVTAILISSSTGLGIQETKELLSKSCKMELLIKP